MITCDLDSAELPRHGKSLENALREAPDNAGSAFADSLKPVLDMLNETPRQTLILGIQRARNDLRGLVDEGVFSPAVIGESEASL